MWFSNSGRTVPRGHSFAPGWPKEWTCRILATFRKDIALPHWNYQKKSSLLMPCHWRSKTSTKGPWGLRTPLKRSPETRPKITLQQKSAQRLTAFVISRASFWVENTREQLPNAIDRKNPTNCIDMNNNLVPQLNYCRILLMKGSWNMHIYVYNICFSKKWHPGMFLFLGDILRHLTSKGKMVGKPLGWGPLNNQPHWYTSLYSGYLMGISTVCPLLKGSNTGGKNSQGYPLKGTAVFPFSLAFECHVTKQSFEEEFEVFTEDTVQ